MERVALRTAERRASRTDLRRISTVVPQMPQSNITRERCCSPNSSVESGFRSREQVAASSIFIYTSSGPTKLVGIYLLEPRACLVVCLNIFWQSYRKNAFSCVVESVYIYVYIACDVAVGLSGFQFVGFADKT